MLSELLSFKEEFCADAQTLARIIMKLNSIFIADAKLGLLNRMEKLCQSLQCFRYYGISGIFIFGKSKTLPESEFHITSETKNGLKQFCFRRPFSWLSVILLLAPVFIGILCVLAFFDSAKTSMQSYLAFAVLGLGIVSYVVYRNLFGKNCLILDAERLIIKSTKYWIVEKAEVEEFICKIDWRKDVHPSENGLNILLKLKNGNTIDFIGRGLYAADLQKHTMIYKKFTDELNLELAIWKLESINEFPDKK